MRIRIPVILFFLCLPGLAYSAGENQALSEGMVNPGYHEKPEWFKLSLLDLSQDVAEAKAAGKRVLLYFYQDGCPYCKKLLEDNFGQRDIVENTRKHFDVIAINMWGDREVVDLQGKDSIEKQFAAQLKVMFTPTLVFLDETGKDVLRINGYYHPEKFRVALDYVSGKHESKSSFADYLARQKPVAASGKLHIDPSYLQPPYALDQVLRDSKKPLLVMFEQKNCSLCDELHLDILQKAEPKEAIKAFNVVLLDRTSNGVLVTPDGQRMKIADWAAKLKIQHAPSLVFFDVDGREAFRTEAYLRTFHIAGAMTYVSTGSYKTQPSFQRYLQAVNEEYTKRGIHVDLMR